MKHYPVLFDEQTTIEPSSAKEERGCAALLLIVSASLQIDLGAY